MYMYLFPVFILVNEINRQIATSEIYLLKRDTSLSGEMEIVFTELLLFWRMKTAMKNMWKFLDQVKVCWKKKFKGFKLTLSSTNFLEDLVRKSNFTGTPAETMDIYSDMHRSFCNPFVPHDLSSQKKGLSFEPIINADSFSLITTKKQCMCLIPWMYHDNN